jgi:hypothetical protein
MRYPFGSAKQHIDLPAGCRPIQLVELLVCQVLESRHEGETKQVAEAKKLLSEAVGFGPEVSRSVQSQAR